MSDWREDWPMFSDFGLFLSWAVTLGGPLAILVLLEVRSVLPYILFGFGHGIGWKSWYNTSKYNG